MAFLLLSLMAICVITKRLTFGGAVAAGVVGTIVYAATGIKGVVLLIVFFTLSVLATAHRKSLKLKLDPSHAQPAGRTAGQVLANGGIAALMALLIILDPSHKISYTLMMACSLSSALSDTLSSELGMVYGKKYYNILSFKEDSKGLNGVISLEGTIIGLIGAAIVGICSSGLTVGALIITVAGLFGNIIDSVLGATLERKHIMGNNYVNFFNTTAAAVFGWVIHFVYAFT